MLLARLQLPLKSKGFAIVKIMVATVIASGLITIDMQRRQKNLINARRIASIQATSQIEKNLKIWLSLPNTVSYSFGDNSNEIPGTPTNQNPPGRQVRVFRTTSGTPPLLSLPVDQTPQQAPNPIATLPDEQFRIQKIITTDGAAPFSVSLVEGRITEPTPPPPPPPPPPSTFELIGYSPLAGINTGVTPPAALPLTTSVPESLDESGWSYIRAMWIDNFTAMAIPVAGDPTNDTLPPLDDPDTSLGTGDLRVLIWTFNNLVDAQVTANSSILNCTTNNNCSAQILDIRLQLLVKTATGLVVSGGYGINCANNATPPVANPLLRSVDISAGNPCMDGYFFRIINSWRNSDQATLFNGHCCQSLAD